MGHGRKVIVQFGLVSIPMRAHLVAHEHDEKRKLAHKECLTPIKRPAWCPKHERLLGDEEVVKVAQVGDRFVVVTDEDVAAQNGDGGSGVLDITDRMDAATFPPERREACYYLGPDRKAAGDGAVKAFALLRAAMERTGSALVAKYAHRGKDHLVALEPGPEGTVLLSYLYYSDEMDPARDVPDVPHDAKVEPKQLEMAVSLVKRLPLRKRLADLDGFADRSAEAMRAAIARKAASLPVDAVKEAPASADDLVAQLQASLVAAARRPKAEKAAAKAGRA